MGGVVVVDKRNFPPLSTSGRRGVGGIGGCIDKINFPPLPTSGLRGGGGAGGYIDKRNFPRKNVSHKKQIFVKFAISKTGHHRRYNVISNKYLVKY